MARSTKKTPVFGYTTARSDKPLKENSNARFRAAERQELQRLVRGDIEPDEFNAPVDPQELTDPWSGPKDGKKYWRGADRKHMRK